MTKIPFKYIPLTFISSDDAIKNQITNTIIFRFLFSKYQSLKPLDDFIIGTQYGYTASAKPIGNSKLLRITDIREGDVNWDNVPFCDCNKTERYELRANDILIARTGGTTGKSFIIKNPPSKAVYASYLIRIRVKEENNPHFINAFLNNYSYWSQISNLKRGAAQPNVNAKKLSKILIPACSKDIQDKIVQFLENKIACPFPELEKSITKTIRIFQKNRKVQSITKTQLNDISQLRQAILQEAIQGKLVPQNPNDEPASKLLERIQAEKAALVKAKKIKKQKPLPPILDAEKPFELPKGWIWCRLGEILEHTFYGPRFSKDAYSKNGIPTIRTTDMFNGVIKLKDTPKVYIENKDKISLYKLRFNDLIITRTGSIGTMALFKENYLAIPSAYLIRCRFIKSKMADFSFKVLLSPFVQNYLGLNTKTGTRPNINAVSIHNLPFPLPPLAEQQRIVAKVENLLALCDQLSVQVERSQADAEVLMQAVLQEAFSKS